MLLSLVEMGGFLDVEWRDEIESHKLTFAPRIAMQKFLCKHSV